LRHNPFLDPSTISKLINKWPWNLLSTLSSGHKCEASVINATIHACESVPPSPIGKALSS
jgi:hypothetical protein